MANVATKWYYEGYDDCNFESPQAPAATQIRTQYRRERDHLDHQQALMGPTGIGRRRLNDHNNLGDASAASLGDVYPRGNHAEGESGAPNQQANRQQSVSFNSDLTQRLRFENLILQHKADQSSFRERQKALSQKVKDVLENEERLLIEGVDPSSPNSGPCATASSESAITDEEIEAADGTDAAAILEPQRPPSPLAVKADSVKARHDRLMELRRVKRPTM